MHFSALWVILPVRYECYLKKDNCTFLFASLAKVDHFKSYKSGDLKKENKNSGCLVVPSLLPLDSFVFSSCTKWLRQIEPFEVYVILHTSSLTEAAVQASAPSLGQVPDEGGSNGTGRNTWTSRITYPWIRLECSWQDSFRSLPNSRERLEVTPLKYSSLGAINSS